MRDMTDLRLRNAIVAGVVLAFASLTMLLLPVINTYVVHSFTTKFALIELTLLIFTASFGLHVYGYVHVADKISSSFLKITTILLVTLASLYGTVVMLLEYSNPYQTTATQDAFVGLLALIYGAAALLFAAALLYEFKRLGWISLCGLLVTLVPVFIFSPWLGLVLPLLSSYALFVAKKTL
jgi:hypothetical protein